VLMSANASYASTERDLHVLTGIKVSHSTQQRLVHRQEFTTVQAEQAVGELSIDGGKVRLRTPTGEASTWRDYKAVNLQQVGCGAYLRDNPALINWVNQQPLATPVICLGDGHDGIWNLFSAIGSSTQRREILDWYHLMENLHKISESSARLKELEGLLWRGQTAEVLTRIAAWKSLGAQKFCDYVRKHHTRIIDYEEQQRVSSIGSGSVESTVKQIGARLKITGAQWKEENVNRVLRQRCAYLNGCLPIFALTQAA